ncbi:heptaprenyl diphosphate synthase [Austwickia chelonae]|uniref:Putative polyprenyl diphosphate synthase n=1 Tax=Austwickia chelonae NBRC 105200 TaxID=1184607 RepID=K6UME9_9MICO|nr:polyprenyl synthetase family protein [Austwickia chelonae]GAB78061.1 putative polyprenyl diphosphate synthase [Austwickia chelonae NBRC 105200]SEV95441.1 heptaprenyl diphosphate synthase [Austwickia chelonae]
MSAQPLPVFPDVDPVLADALQAGLGRVDAFLREKVDHEDPFVAEANGHLLAAGGKRFRPLLTLLAAHVGSGVNDEVVGAAAAVELTHLASLYHDDVMDEADVRRHVVSANAAYGNSTAILVGDLLFGTASSIVADLGAEAVKIQAETFVRLCSGQIRDTRPCPPGQDPVDYYLGVLADKTGVLIATAARFGAMFSGCADDQVEILRQYGEKLGIAFQLADDLLDISSEGESSGKTPGTDLREGVATLPVIYARAENRSEDGELLELLDRDLRADDAGVARALELLRVHPAVERAREHTWTVAREAQEVVGPLGDGPAVRALREVAAGVVDREV